ncbi:MAG: hypothetical protein RLZZ414_1176, partial [Bacteroidota bacterium]
MKKNLLLLALLLSITYHVQSKVYTVSTTTGNEWQNPPLPGSFFAAIDSANINPGLDTIVFNLPGNSLVNGNNWNLASFTGPVFINGYSTQDGGAIRILSAMSFNASASNSRVEGLISQNTDGDRIVISGSNISFKKITVNIGSSTSGRAFVVTGNNNILDSVFNNTGNIGAEITGNNNIVRNSELSNFIINGTGNQLYNVRENRNSTGLIVRGSNHIIRKAQFTSLGNNLDAVQLEDASNVILDSITINQAQQRGIYILRGGNITIKNSQISNSTTNHGISIENSTNNRLDSNIVSNSGQNGVLVIGGSNDTRITNSIFFGNNINGVGIANSLRPVIENCVFRNNDAGGVSVEANSNNALIRKVQAYENGEAGINLVSVNNALVENSISYSNLKSGVNVTNGSGNRLNDLNVFNNHSNIAVDIANKPIIRQGAINISGTNTIVENCFVYNNRTNGIIVHHETNTTNQSIIRNNTIGKDTLLNSAGNDWNGVYVSRSNGVQVNENIIVNNGAGTLHDANPVSLNHMPDRISGVRYENVSSGSINNNFIGTDNNKANLGNAFDGITLHTNANNINVIGNTINHNGFNSVYGTGGGIALRNTANNNIIRSNFIGMHADSTDGGNNDYGISIEVGTGNIIGGDNPLQGNVIANSKNAAGRGVGIWLVLLGNSNNSVFNNLITNHVNEGVIIERGARNNIIGNPTRGNIISNNKNGILVRRGLEWDNSRGATTFGNNFRSNSFICNSEQGILLTDEGNNLYGKPNNVKTILVETNESRPSFVSGYAPSANAIVDIYVKDTLCRVDCDNNASQGNLYVTSVTAAATASSNGLFMWEFDLASPSNVGNVVTKSNVIVMATQAGSNPVPNSSEFSTCTPEITCVTPTNVSITGNNNVCTGGNSTLTANADDLTVGEDYIYTWYRGSILPANIIATNTNQNTININTAGNYFVVIANTIDSAACSDVNATPFAFNVAQTPTNVNITGDNSVCTGQNSVLTANGTIDNNVANNYAW